ncbi:MAG: GNAT family N-acetyltransferase [Hydrogenophaga sp.]|uniref:GNAT family N-acetyltransferase n=1 Tax=Hydrogenophaga sp. TaxID=1904254 RepID=UPI001BC193BC|nr:GNAT family N-acetyltransferase [Hydrogenophaga sp.]MBS3911074.1 GNAT family N-acetyltransferase [Hydrogenophaga sp.]MDO9149663.1 GNAT family N-acetyltransferase [Hydrogenophaga sp.]MDO9606618.1 GNAT family N-acetyltransferase [Hydrogenophaga sp.]
MSAPGQTYTPAPIRVVRADYANPAHADAMVMLLDAYARDPAGGGEPLSDFARRNLVPALASRPQAYSVLAWDGDAPVGLVNCMEGFSTFACKPLVNVHDVAVLASHRGRGVAQQMLALAEAMARECGAVKMTLEVLSGNASARKLYERMGFVGYQLDPAMGTAQFMQKLLPPQPQSC